MRKLTRQGLPDVVPLSYHTGSLPVDRCLDQSRHLNALVVSDSLLDQFALVERIDGGRQDDKGSDVGPCVGFQDQKVDISVQSGVWQRVDGKQRRFGIGVGAQVRVNLQGIVVSGSIL